jgi:hypothetical protein
MHKRISQGQQAFFFGAKKTIKVSAYPQRINVNFVLDNIKIFDENLANIRWWCSSPPAGREKLTRT